eukprot:10875598-Alexandrium_andersonii.AAC.1
MSFAQLSGQKEAGSAPAPQRHVPLARPHLGRSARHRVPGCPGLAAANGVVCAAPGPAAPSTGGVRA